MLKQHLKALILTMAFLSILLPLASNAPDGLERVAQTFGIEEQEPIWRGLMPDYALPTIENPYLSTLLAGTFGVLLVLGIAFIVGMAIAKPNKQ